MLTKTTSLNEITWENIQLRYGREKFITNFSTSDFVGFVNWTMIPYMSDLWESILKEFCPANPHVRRKVFFDLADPEKRNPQDIARALKLIVEFERFFEVILGLNEKEAYEIGSVLGLDSTDRSRNGLAALTQQIQKHVPISALVVHPVSFALAAGDGVVSVVDGPFVDKPLITTGAGDHFNAGFCLGKVLGFDDEMSVLVGVTTSGFYVRHAQSPRLTDLVEMLRNWPAKES